MLKTKMLLFFMLLFFQVGFAQSFTYSGPTSVTVPFNSTSQNGTYYFSYQNMNGLCYPCLVVSVNNNVISSDLCNNPSTPGYFSISFTPGTHTVKFKLLSINCNTLNCYDLKIHQEVEFTVTCYFQISVENNFGGGTIYANGSASSPARISSNTSSVSLGAEEQSFDNYTRVWNTNGTNNSNWFREASYGSSQISSSQNTSYSIQSHDLNTKIIANLRSLCNLTFSNPGRAIYLNGNTYNSSVTANVVEQNTVSPSAEGYFVVNGIEHAFQNLWKSSSSGQNYATVTASQHDTYTAVYRIQAVNPAITFGSNLNMPIVINWTDNQNSNVTQYRIHRREYNNGWSADQIIANVNSGVQTYTDNEYILKPWRQNTWLEYGITAYYTVNSSWSTGGANTQVYGLQTLMQTDESTLINREIEVPTNYSISNHPNPFNPATTINYQLPQDGMVTIKVYDIIGKEVATLVNEQKSAGYYKADFDASRLTSGVYIATIQASGFNKSIKLLLTK